MNDEQKLHAFFANEAYKKDPIKSYMGYQLEYSDPYTKVYKSDIDHKKVFAVRGTDGWKDIMLDARLGLGGKVRDSDRYKASEDVVKRYFDPRYNIDFAAHSLGGSISNELSKRFGSNASLFNPYINREGLSTAASVITTGDDPLQAANKLGGTSKLVEQMARDVVKLDKTGMGPGGAHSIERFL